MVDLVLTDEQVAQLSTAETEILLRDSVGTVLARASLVKEHERIHGWTIEEIQEAKRRAASEGPWHTMDEVRARLHSLGQQCQDSR